MYNDYTVLRYAAPTDTHSEGSLRSMVAAHEEEEEEEEQGESHGKTTSNTSVNNNKNTRRAMMLSAPEVGWADIIQYSTI